MFSSPVESYKFYKVLKNLKLLSVELAFEATTSETQAISFSKQGQDIQKPEYFQDPQICFSLQADLNCLDTRYS